jgi:hypothetical protein
LGIDRARPCPRAFRRLALMDLEYRPRSGNAAPARLANTFTDMATTR